MKCNIYLFISVLFAGTYGFAGSEGVPLPKEITKTISQTFNTGSQGHLVISNRYGDVDIETTSGTSVEFEILITVEAKNDETGRDMLDQIDVDFKHTDNKVEAITEIGKNSGWRKKYNTISYQIDYKVRVPDRHTVNVTNRYGDVALADRQNDVQLELKYGNANIQSIDGNLVLNIGYVKSLSFGEIAGNLDIVSSYSKVHGGKAGNAIIKTKYSFFEIGSLENVDIQSAYDEFEFTEIRTLTNVGKYDEWFIDKAGEVSIETKYSKVKINYLESVGQFESGYGTVSILKVGPQFSSISIESRYTGYRIDVDHAFDLDLTTKYVSVSVPDEMNYSERIKDHSTLILKGYHKQKGMGKIQAVMNYGNLKINR